MQLLRACTPYAKHLYTLKTSSYNDSFIKTSGKHTKTLKNIIFNTNNKINKDMCSQPIHKVIFLGRKYFLSKGRCDVANTDLEKS